MEDFIFSEEEEESFTFEDFARRQTEATSEALLEIESILYSENNILQFYNLSNDKNDAIRKPRYFDSGYDAHVDGVDGPELLTWKNNFPYFLVEGKNIWKDSHHMNDDAITNIPSANYMCGKYLILRIFSCDKVSNRTDDVLFENENKWEAAMLHEQSLN